MHHVAHTDMNDRELNAAYITSSYYCVPQVKISQDTCIFVWCSSVKVCCMSFFSFYWRWRVRFSSAFCFGMTAVNESKNGMHFARKFLSMKWSIKCRKLHQVLQVSCFFKMQKPIGHKKIKCQLLMDTPPPPHTPPLDTHAYISMEMTFLF